MTAPLAFVLVVLAATRLTRLLVLDDLFEPWWRQRVLDRFPPTPAGEGPRWRNKVGDLVSCGYCTGWWASGLMFAVAHLVGLVEWPVRFDVVAWWAVAGAQMILNALDARL
jgi:hypothetical protein